MLHGNITKQSRSKSRNQRKRERMKNTALTLVMVALWAVLAVMMVKTWVNEPTVSAAEHKAYIASLDGER